MSDLAAISLGSNLGDRLALLDAAVASIGAIEGVEILGVSTYHETVPVGGPSGQGAFLNAAATVRTSLSADDLARHLREIEHRAGRVREVRWDQRTLDLDLILFGGLILDTPELTVPHPRMAVRRFVLGPLDEIAPAMVDPTTGRTVRESLANLDRRPSVVALVGDAGGALSRRIAEALDGVGEPDGWLVVALGPPGEVARSSILPTFLVPIGRAAYDMLREDRDEPGGVPILYPGDDADANRIVAEALAACQASRAG